MSKSLSVGPPNAPGEVARSHVGERRTRGRIEARRSWLTALSLDAPPRDGGSLRRPEHLSALVTTRTQLRAAETRRARATLRKLAPSRTPTPRRQKRTRVAMM